MAWEEDGNPLPRLRPQLLPPMEEALLDREHQEERRQAEMDGLPKICQDEEEVPYTSTSVMRAALPRPSAQQVSPWSVSPEWGLR